jgi:hypothetical protein
MSSYFAKIDVTKINKEWLFQGANGAKYLDMSIRDNKDGPGRYGDTHMIIQNPSREAKTANPQLRGNIIGNAKKIEPRGQAPAARQNPPPQENIDEDVPF